MGQRNRAIILSAACIFFLMGQAYFALAYKPLLPLPDQIKEFPGSAKGDMLAVSFSLRRLAADVWFIRLMQYYGTREICDAEGPEHDALHCEHGLDYASGKYPLFAPMAMHILRLDPYFSNAVLYSAASLAFNMSRASEASDIINYALLYDTKNWKLVTLLSAIGYSKSSDPKEIASVITPLVKERDCPVMIKQLAAFLNKKAGNYRAAYDIYRDIRVATKDEFYIANAEREILKLELAYGFGK